MASKLTGAQRYLEDCLSKLHEQQQDSLSKLRKENIACAQAQSELKTTLARVTTHLPNICVVMKASTSWQ